MHLSVSEFWAANPPETPFPYRLLDEAGSVIENAFEFDDEEGWIRVMCRADDGRIYCAKGTDHLVTQRVHMPFRVVPYTPDLDALPRVYVDTVKYNGGEPTGDWEPR